MMHIGRGVERERAIVLRTKKFSETSLLVYWCTQESGIVHTVARGGLRPGSPFAGKIDLFCSAEIGYGRSSRSDLHNLREVEVITHHRLIQEDYTSLVAASYFVQLIELVAERETPIPELYHLLCRAFGYLGEKRPTRRVVERFEARLAEYLGIARADRTAHELIRETYHRIPLSRVDLMELLEPRGKSL